MAYTKKAQQVTIKVCNTEVVLGQNYEVIPKFDADAPDGMQEYNTTKNLTQFTGEVHGAVFDETFQSWDTGFDIDSLCNAEIPDGEKLATVNLYNKHIKEPYEKRFRKDLSSADTKDSFWATFSYNIWKGRIFDTNNPKDLLELFQALKQFKICEVGEKSYLARLANYNVTNKETILSIEDDRNEKEAEAIFTYKTLEKGDKETLSTVLEWLTLITGVRTSDEGVLRRQVMNYLKKSHVNVENFLNAYKMTQTDQGKEEMEIFAMVMKLYNKKALVYKRKQLHLNEEVLGNSPKDIAKRAVTNQDLMKTIVEAHEKLSPALV